MTGLTFEKANTLHHERVLASMDAVAESLQGEDVLDDTTEALEDLIKACEEWVVCLHAQEGVEFLAERSDRDSAVLEADLEGA